MTRTVRDESPDPGQVHRAVHGGCPGRRDDRVGPVRQFGRDARGVGRQLVDRGIEGSGTDGQAVDVGRRGCTEPLHRRRGRAGRGGGRGGARPGPDRRHCGGVGARRVRTRCRPYNGRGGRSAVGERQELRPRQGGRALVARLGPSAPERHVPRPRRCHGAQRLRCAHRRPGSPVEPRRVRARL